MLLPLRLLLFEASATNQGRGGTFRKRPRRRRIAQWSEVGEVELTPMPRPREDVVIEMPGPIILTPRIATGEVVAEIAPFDYEIAAILQIIDAEKEIAEVREVDALISELEKVSARFPEMRSIELIPSS